MATKHTSPCLQKAADDEPIFVLRAQDKTAPAIIRKWVKMQQIHNPNPSPAKLNSALALALEMESWHTRKYPD